MIFRFSDGNQESRILIPGVLVQVQLLQIGGLWSGPRLGRSHYTAQAQREFHAKERAEHRNRIVAPQSPVTPDNVFGHAHDPARNSSIAGVLKFPPPPDFFSRGGMDSTWAVLPVATEVAFMTVVVLARVK